MPPPTTKAPSNDATLMRQANRFASPTVRASLRQILNSTLPFCVLWYLMYLSLGVSYLLTLALAVPAAGFLVRTFIIQHDCGHGSFFASKRLNSVVGQFCSLFTVTPYERWRHDHAVHHAHVGNLDRRGIGDIPTITVAEYQARSPWRRFCYRVSRHPLIIFGVVPPFLFAVAQRLPSRSEHMRLFWSVMGTNLAITLVYGSLLWLVGWQAFLLIHVPIFMVYSSAGVWLFFVQHQFEQTYWERDPSWSYVDAALLGSSHYRLPAVLQWFTGNIGLHHIHHLSPRIPNYNLQPCHDSAPEFSQAPVLTLRTSIRSAALALWDEDRRRLISFAELA